jgi:hypothetical protein
MIETMTTTHVLRSHHPKEQKRTSVRRRMLNTIKQTALQTLDKMGWTTDPSLYRLGNDSLLNEKASQRQSGIWLTPARGDRWSIQVHWSFPSSKPLTTAAPVPLNVCSLPSWNEMPVLLLEPAMKTGQTGSPPPYAKQFRRAQPSSRQSVSGKSSTAGRLPEIGHN